MASRCYSHGKQETDEEFDARWVTYFNKPDIDAWELRKGKFVYKGDAESLKANAFVKFEEEKRSTNIVVNSCQAYYKEIVSIFWVIITQETKGFVGYWPHEILNELGRVEIM